MKYMHSNHVLEADTAAGIVEEMRRGSFGAERTLDDYMLATAARAEAQTGKKVRTTSPEDFVADLVSVGLLEEVQ